MRDHTVPLRRNRAFRWLLGGSSVSMLGSRLTTIAYPLLILSLHGSPVIAGLAVFAANAPSVLVYLPAGVLVDRWEDPRRMLLAAEAGRGIAIGVIVASLLTHQACISLIILMAIIEESLEVFAMLAERRCVRFLVEPAQALSAQVGIEARAHAVLLVGRSLGGLLFGIAQVLPFFADFLSFAVSIGSLRGIRRGQEWPVLPARMTRSNFAGEVRDGLRELFRNAFARQAALLSAGMTLVTQALIIMFLAEADGKQVSSVVIGSVLAASGAGGLLGALIGQRVRRSGGLSSLKLQPVICTVMLAILALAGQWQPPVMALAMTVIGFAGAMANVELDTYLILKVPDKKLARVTSIVMLLDFSANALGPALGGLLTGLSGAGTVVWALLGVSIVITMFGLRMRVPVADQALTETGVAVAGAVPVSGYKTGVYLSRPEPASPRPAGLPSLGAWRRRDSASRYAPR